jgi:hypothetical protein
MVFKRCTGCDAGWPTREGFLSDSAIQLVGYQCNFETLALGWFLFNHLGCGSTIEVRAGRFRDLHDGPVYAERVTGTDECYEYCLYDDNLERCPAHCECAYVREILQILRRWPKTTISG